MFCSVLWPARLAVGPPQPPLVPGLEQSPLEQVSVNTMRVVVVGPLSGDGEERGVPAGTRMGGTGATQLLQLGFRSPLDWVRVKFP